MSSQSGQELENIYMDYLQEAKSLQKESVKPVLPYLILGGIFLCGGFSAILWAGYRTMVTLIFWGIVLSLIIEVVGILIQAKWLKEESARIAQTKPGFVDFFKLYRQRRWPKQMVTGKHYEKFLAIIGRKESA